MARAVDIVPHTHWDREWYLPFQRFRMRLVELLDDLLPRLDADPSYAHFMLDGQMAVVDDYLAIRPEAAPTIRRLVSQGRLSIGPWYVLMDEFLVSGETMIRDLRLGLDRAAALGGGMEVGYLPDMFGHVAQMPQLLDQFGFEHAVVWRGVPSNLDRAAFRWEAPDGTAVRAAYLPAGYGNGADLPDDAKELVALIDGFIADHGAMAGDPLLWMNGTDHQLPRPWLGRVVAEANQLQDDFRLRITSLAGHLRTAADADDNLPLWRGELRSAARANLLPGVASNRVDVHQAAARAEAALERRTEPLAALYLEPSEWPAPFLAEAWLAVVHNSAHDSICACSVDEVADAVLHRFAEATSIADGITERVLATIATAAGGDLPVIVNPTARTRSGVVEIDGTPTRVDGVPGFGWCRLDPVGPDVAPVTTTGDTIGNGLLEVRVDRDDGTWSLNGLTGFGRLVDDGDAGDTYNYCPPAVDVVVDQPESVEVRAIESGPDRARLAVQATYRWPHHLVDGARTGERTVEVVTTIELRAGDDVLRVVHEIDNRSRDHRLRAWLPLPEPATGSRAECAFAILERGLHGEGGPTEAEIATFPSRRFVTAGGLSVVHEGLHEYELVDIREDGKAHALALTLLRCTGVISQGPMPSRPLPAGPNTPVEGAQMLGSQRVAYALHLGGRNPYSVADEVLTPLLVTEPAGGTPSFDEHRALAVTGAEVSAVTRDAGRLVVRVHNPSEEPARVVIEHRSGWLVDLRGRPIEPFEGGFELRAFGIATATLDG